MFVVRKNSDAATDEERARLEVRPWFVPVNVVAFGAWLKSVIS